MNEQKFYPDEPRLIPEEKLESFEIDGTQYKTALHLKYKNRKPYEPLDHKIIKAAIPGVIRKLYVKEGAKVKKGDKLVVLEAMKMKNDLLTNEQGVVDEILVKVGDHVSKDAVLVRLR